jgi:FtsH-binding integral membrane protein
LAAASFGDFAKLQAYPALALYLDFINLFMLLLPLFGQRRQN